MWQEKSPRYNPLYLLSGVSGEARGEAEGEEKEMSVKTSIGWTDLTCNPIKGLCQGGCWYCYYSGERGIARRFKQNPELRLDLSVFDKLPKAPKRVFLYSTNDYWGGWIPDEWREAIREKILEYPQHTFQVLTKQYQNLSKDSPYPDNWWVGGTVTNNDDYYPFMFNDPYNFRHIEAKVKFISFEPLLEKLLPSFDALISDFKMVGLDWVIIGRLTGYGHKYDPKIEWVEEIELSARRANIPIFEKDNLKPLLQRRLI